MKHDNDHLKFPSGNTVEFCRKKAKKRVKEEKAKGKELKLLWVPKLKCADRVNLYCPMDPLTGIYKIPSIFNDI